MSEMTTTVTTVPAGSGPGAGYPGGGLIRGDVTTVGRLQQAARSADVLAEQVQLALVLVHAAASTLPDRLAAADWGTDDITSGGTAIGDAVAGNQLDAEALAGLIEQLHAMGSAVDAAEQLGAEVLAKRADGQAEAFVDA
jgi:hypothetical protein